jgi:hypothetical protein
MTTVSEIVNKPVSQLTPDDFAVLRREYPALAETRSVEYDKWWMSLRSSATPRSTTAEVQRMTPLSKALATEVQRDIEGRDGEKLQEWAKRSPFLPSPLAVVASLAAKIAALEAKIAELEQRPAAGLKYCGTWDGSRVYAKDEAITHAGAMWVALTSNISRRPPADGVWKLAVRKGSDGKDGRCVCKDSD